MTRTGTVIRYAPAEDILVVHTTDKPTKDELEKAGYAPMRVDSRDGAEKSWAYALPGRQEEIARARRRAERRQREAARG